MTRQVAEAICLEHDTRADGTLDYASLCDDIFDGDFDHFAHQQHFVYKVSERFFCPDFLFGLVTTKNGYLLTDHCRQG